MDYARNDAAAETEASKTCERERVSLSWKLGDSSQLCHSHQKHNCRPKNIILASKKDSTFDMEPNS